VVRTATVVDALLFDLGNVLLEVDFARAIAHWAHGAGVPERQIAARFSFDHRFEAYERGELGDAQYLAALRESLGIALSDEQLRAGWNAIFVRAVPGVEALLPVLASTLPLYGYSNTNAMHETFWRARYRDVLAPITTIFCSHELGMRKPDPASFRHVADRIGAAPSRVAFFDDHPDNVRGARAAGMVAFHVTSAAEMRRALAADLGPAL
jgi:putative hydrolase of the HAD superfamily